MNSKELVERLRLEVEYDNDEPDGPGEVTYGRVFLEAASAIEALERRLDEALKVARSLTKALVQLTPGGSEYFTRHGEDYFADIAACQRVIRERFDSGHKAKLDRVELGRRAQAAEAHRDRLEAALRFYAEPTNYRGELVPGHDDEHGTFTLTHHVNAVREDAGKIARAALDEAKQ